MSNYNEDEIDTAPVIIKDNPRVTHESIDISPNERAEIILAPARAVRRPTLYMSNEFKSCQVIVEQITHGRSPIVSRENQEIDYFRFGMKLDVTVTDSEPVKIVIVNVGNRRTSIGAYLVAHEDPKNDTTYRLKGDEIAKNKG
jgi:hypothetical protein